MSVRIERGGFTPRQPTSYPARQSWFSRCTELDLKRKPVGDDLRACIPIERRQRAINRRKRAKDAVWIERSSQSLEQAGTEFDCKPSGEAVYSAWYELVPSAGRTIKMTVRPVK